MELKKNPKADLNRNSGLYFAIGLALSLFVVWRLFEYKTYSTVDEVVQVINVQEILKEDIPITRAINTPPPPPPPLAPEIIEVVSDVSEVEETFIESSDINQETVIQETIAVEDIEVIEVEEEITVPFAVIENVPVFPGCEKMKTNDQKKACFQQKIQEHVKSEFNYPATALELNIQGRVFVYFTIDQKGAITNIQTRGPDISLEKEAGRIIAALPRMKPGMQRGSSVKMPYSVPITFKMASYSDQ
ncbi:energy transducer TonB [Cellulophaga baltica]|uniref:energy transducer TonB n=1 Tax=Cellulophaga TaxID=104264 RepID=UPI001C06E855|nr:MULTISPECIES: energy transducer TonB [Cellulophaga]MBU2994857.1 energy transducer TonB [Cellulophaga baltica]MDO6766252.1 energy transducer TonB [Cellulophaga sp. 1_MG-2023]